MLGGPCVVGPGWAYPWAAARRYFGHRSQAYAFRLDCSVCRWAAALPPPTGTAPRPRSQASHPAITHIIAEPTPNSARNSPTTISNLEFTTLELQRFQTLLKLHPIELRATFLRTSPAATAHGHRAQALSNLAVSGTGIPRGYPQALFLSDSYPQGSDSAWITRCHTRSVDVDGPTRGPTKE